MSDAGSKRVLLLGGSSEIGVAIVRRLALESPVRVLLLGRDHDRIATAAATLERGGSVTAEVDLIDAEDLACHRQALERAFERMGGFVDIVVLAIGVLGGQAGLDAAREEATEVMRVNFVGSGSLLLESLRCLRRQGSGTLVVLSTVAVERPRASNPIYGAAKSGLDALAQGLADASAGTGARVLVVRPGFVTTKMTAGLPPPPMSTTPDAVADATVRALSGSAHTIWVPARLRLVFTVVRHLPRVFFQEVAAVRRNTLLVDAGIAALIAILVLILAPGLAVVAIIALFVMLVCAVSLVLDLRRGRSRRTSRRRAARPAERPRRVR